MNQENLELRIWTCSTCMTKNHQLLNTRQWHDPDRIYREGCNHDELEFQMLPIYIKFKGQLPIWNEIEVL
jgi:hypothetical protein